MTGVTAALAVLVAAGFAFVNGVNNGGGLVAVAAGAGMVPLEAVGLLGLGLGLAPLAGGTRVAGTLGAGLVHGDPTQDATAVLLGVVVAMAATAALNRRGLPTSLTLATVGGVVGVGAGAALPVRWATVAGVVGVALVVPLVVALASPLAVAALSTVLGGGRRVPAGRARVAAVRRAVFALQAFAYGANDGQRMLAVLAAGLAAVAASRSGGPALGASTAAPGGVSAAAGAAGLAALVGLFCLGALVGTRHVGMRLTRRLPEVGALPGAASELTAALSSLAAAHAGTPVSMTQATTAALIGTHRARGRRQVRWEEVTRLATAWAVTAPASLLTGALVGHLTLGVGPR